MVSSTRGSISALPAVGMLIGLLLLGFAGVVLITSSTSVGQRRTESGEFLSRQLQGFGYITTSRSPSSLDSSDSTPSGSSFEPSKSSFSGSMESSEWNEVFPKILKTWGGSMGYVTFSLLIQFIFGILYSRVVTSPIVASGILSERMKDGRDEGLNDFSNNICGCFDDRWVCLQGLCCPMVRIAHTNAVSGVCPFWESLWCYCCCAWLTLNIGPFCLLMWWRLRLKSIMKVEENMINDFCVTMLCPQISICQMSSAVDNAMNYQITGCCEYTPYGGLTDDYS